MPHRSPADDAPPAIPEAPSPRRGRILVADDEALIALSLRQILGADHEVVVTHSCKAALDRLTAGEHFDVILCDLMMPGHTGVDLWEAVPPAVRRRILFLSAGPTTDAVEAFLVRVHPPVMGKPFDPEALRAEVARRLAEGQGAG